MPTLETVKERPILYSGEMVRAILKGAKTQTRRVVNPQPAGSFSSFGKLPTCDCHPFGFHDGSRHYPCRQGKPGDRLWVRETWGLLDTQPSDGPAAATLGYRADGEEAAPNGRHQLWRPSIFMPRWACRIVLEITDVRVQRIQDIGDEDILAEGIEEYGRALGWPCSSSPRLLWGHLWDRINGKRDGGRYAWDRNPWTWAITFRVLKQDQSPAGE